MDLFQYSFTSRPSGVQCGVHIVLVAVMQCMCNTRQPTHIPCASCTTLLLHRFFTYHLISISSHFIMAQRSPDFIELDYLLQEVREGLLLHPAHAGAVRIVIESETGEQLHVVKVDARCHRAHKHALPPRPRPAPSAEPIEATPAVQVDEQQQRNVPEQALLLQQCNEQQQRITELEQQLQQMQQEFHQHTALQPSVHLVSLSPASNTDDESSSSSSSSNDGSLCSDDDGDEHVTSIVAMVDDADESWVTTGRCSRTCPPPAATGRKCRASLCARSCMPPWTRRPAACSPRHSCWIPAAFPTRMIEKTREQVSKSQAPISETCPTPGWIARPDGTSSGCSSVVSGRTWRGRCSGGGSADGVSAQVQVHGCDGWLLDPVM